MDTNMWIAVVIVVVLVLAYAAYKYNPAWFSSILGPPWLPVRDPHSPTSCGGNIPLPPGTSINSMADCQKACVDSPTCQGIFRDETNNSCWLKDKGWCPTSWKSTAPNGLWAYAPRAGKAPLPTPA
jgi:hypothetical protein